jgi:hypothetical protein
VECQSFEQVTLDDIWKLDLSKLTGWVLVKDNTAGKEDFEDEEETEHSSSSNSE